MIQKEHSIEIVRYTNAFKQQWDRFVDEAKNGTFLFRRDFMEYHKDRFEDYSLMIFKGKKLKAILPATISQNIISSHNGLSYGGFIVKQSLTFDDFTQVVYQTLKFLNEKGCSILKIKLIPEFYSSIPSQEFNYILFLLNAKLYRKDAYYMMPSTNYSLNRNRKRALERAEKQNFEVKQNDDFEAFWDTLLIPNLYDRFKVKPVHTKHEIIKLHELFPENIKLFSIYKEGVMQAGVVMFLLKNVAHFQYSSGNSDRDNAALDVLFNEIIKFYKDKKYISFGSSSESEGRILNRGLMHWKESFGAYMINQDFYLIDTNNYPLLENIFS